MANNTERDAEIAGLKAHIARLEARLAKLEPKPAPVAQSRDRPVVITHLTPVARPDAVPTDAEFLQLQQVALSKFPALELAGLAPDEYHRQFRRAFNWLLVIDRLERDRVDTSRFLVDWIDRARRYNQNSDILVRPFVAACIAVGDVVIYSNFSNLPFDTSIGLRDMHRGGGDHSVGWKRVLAGDLLMPVAPPKTGGPVSISFR